MAALLERLGAAEEGEASSHGLSWALGDVIYEQASLFKDKVGAKGREKPEVAI